jgi:hypothetical protein
VITNVVSARPARIPLCPAAHNRAFLNLSGTYPAYQLWGFGWRRGWDSNPRMEVLQTSPLGHLGTAPNVLV